MARERIEAIALDGKIAELVSGAVDCRQCLVGPVVLQQPDNDGCNWRISRISGSHCFECLQAIRPLLSQLQERFELAGGEDEQSFLTTWALR